MVDVKLKVLALAVGNPPVTGARVEAVFKWNWWPFSSSEKKTEFTNSMGEVTFPDIGAPYKVTFNISKEGYISTTMTYSQGYKLYGTVNHQATLMPESGVPAEDLAAWWDQFMTEWQDTFWLLALLAGTCIVIGVIMYYGGWDFAFIRKVQERHGKPGKARIEGTTNRPLPSGLKSKPAPAVKAKDVEVGV